MQVKGYIIRETEKALAVVLEGHVKNGVRPLWLPRSKVTEALALDEFPVLVVVHGEGQRKGKPAMLTIDDDFAAKVLMVVEV